MGLSCARVISSRRPMSHYALLGAITGVLSSFDLGVSGNVMK